MEEAEVKEEPLTEHEEHLNAALYEAELNLVLAAQGWVETH
jgi:hypothetical protein